MAMLVMRNGAEVFRLHAEEDKADHHPRRTGQRNVPWRDEDHVCDGERKFPAPLLRANLQKDQLMRFIQAKCKECLLHLENPDHQNSFFFWSIMELFCNRDGRVMMSEIATLLYKGYGLLRRKLGRVVNREDWCLPLAELLCSTAPRDQHKEEIVKMGDDFTSRGWTYAAQICYVVAGMELGARRHFELVGYEGLPKGDLALLTEVMERTEVYEYVLSLTSGSGQSHFQNFKLFYAHELALAGLDAPALDYCENICTEILRFPQSHEVCTLELLVKLCDILLREKQKEPEWVRKLQRLLEERQGPPQFHPSQHKEFDSRYIKGELLGQGGFGSVFAGVRKADGKEVAIKCIAKRPEDEFITIPGETRSLPLEVALMEMVSKPPHCEHVIQMLEWFETPAFYILVLERPNPCMDLWQFCKMNNGPLPEAVAKKIMLQVVKAARHCCDRRVFHRDIKPENILINPHTLDVKLIDFGCGDLLKKGHYRVYAGTPGFWPWEWVTNGKYRAVPATVWSLGVVLYYLVSGHMPFQNDEEIYEYELTFSPDLSSDCCDLITHCMEQLPRFRAKFPEILKDDWFKQECLEDQTPPAV